MPTASTADARWVRRDPNAIEGAKPKEIDDQFLEAADRQVDGIGVGVPAFVVDFKRFFTLPPYELAHRLAAARRRCRLLPPYLEHFSSRFASYLSRVAPSTARERRVSDALKALKKAGYRGRT